MKTVFGKLSWLCCCPVCGSPPVQRHREGQRVGGSHRGGPGGREGRGAGARSLLIMPKKTGAVSGL